MIDCDGQGIGSGVILFLNKEIIYYGLLFVKIVISCNNKRECILQKIYVENMEEILFCFFIIDYVGLLCYSVEYECILGNFIIDVLKVNVYLDIKSI